MKKIIALLCLFFAFAHSQIVWAGAVGPWIGSAAGSNAAGSLVYYSNGGYSKAQSAMGVQSRWNPDVLASVGSGVNVTQKYGLPVGAGVAQTTLSGLITPLTVLATVGTILGSPAVATVAAIALLPGVLDWLLAADARPAAVGSPSTFEVKNSSTCSVAPCYQYSPDQIGGYYPSKDAACKALVIWWGGQNSSYTGTVTGNFCQIDPGGPTKYIYQSEIAAQPAVWKPANYADFSQKLSGVPVSTALINSLIDAGYTFPLDGQSVTGPASITGTPVVSKTESKAANGDSITTTQTTTPTSTLTYGSGTDPATGKPVAQVTSSTTTSTTTNVFNNTTNSTVSNTTNQTNNPAPVPKTPEEVSFSDPNFSDVPKLYERKYPDGMTGVWETKSAEIKSTPLFSVVQNLMPTNIGTGGTCPTWPMNMTYASWANFGVHDVAPPCWVWEFGKVVIVISSLLLARSLIFGG